MTAGYSFALDIRSEDSGLVRQAYSPIGTLVGGWDDSLYQLNHHGPVVWQLATEGGRHCDKAGRQVPDHD